MNKLLALWNHLENSLAQVRIVLHNIGHYKDSERDLSA